MTDWKERHDEAKNRVGEAPYGSREYWRNAAKVLSVHAGPGMKPETRAKLEALAQSEDPATSLIARAALEGVCYWPDLQATADED
ncbi:MAG: hypothetical protein ONB15_00075 [candidate division KSB1 bacterium]|nr:hypothetical protein [candidate division KSB1 bacterium]